MRKEELRTYIENHESEMIEDLKSLIRIPSEKQAAEPGKPFGAPAAEALAQGIEILEKYGFAVTNYDNYAIAADFNQEEKGLDILAHLDVVPAGEGWQETDPFTPLIKEKCSAAEPQTTKDRRSQLSTQCALSKNSVIH